MSEKIKPTTADVVAVSTDKVVCDGPAVSKHPQVVLVLEDGEAVCPYCGRVFKASK